MPENEGFRKASTILTKLDKIRWGPGEMRVKYSKAKPLIADATRILLGLKNFLTTRPIWVALHERMAQYYDYLNNINMGKAIPLFRVTLHNEVVPLWIKAKDRGKLKGTLLHCDTHDDMGTPENPDQLVTKRGGLRVSAVNKGACNRIYLPVTCLVLDGSISDVIWAFPKWVYDNDAAYTQAIVLTKEREFKWIRPDYSPKDEFLGDVEIVPEKKMNRSLYSIFREIEFHRIKASSAKGWTKILEALPGKHFILDIDLDFIVCNGDLFSKSEYMNTLGDIQSHGRVHEFPPITTPREMFQHQDDVVGMLNRELHYITQRINTMLDGLEKLKKHGKVPSVINLSDSSASFYSGDPERAVITNQYCPGYFVPYIHFMLIPGLHRLYGPRAFV